MAGVMTAEQCGYCFSSPSRQASSNYGIGNDGTIACYVEEENAAWTSSSYWNDNQAVTMEVSNSYAGGDWPISDAAWKSMIELCADICKRYGIEPSYTGDSSGTFTEHRMFAATGCPGEYIHARMNKIVEEVKKAMNGKTGEWVKDKNGWWYSYSDGGYPASKWEFINGKWYYFNENGYMHEGWLAYGGKWYYLLPENGYMVEGWKKIKWNGKTSWFWFDGDGAMFSDGFLKIKGKWYAFDKNGVMIEDDKLITVDKDGVIKIA
jgi:hypothetical protein